MIGKNLSHYEITGHLGQGGMGEVYRARDTKLGREVALKILPARMAADPGVVDRIEALKVALPEQEAKGLVIDGDALTPAAVLAMVTEMDAG